MYGFMTESTFKVITIVEHFLMLDPMSHLISSLAFDPFALVVVGGNNGEIIVIK